MGTNETVADLDQQIAEEQERLDYFKAKGNEKAVRDYTQNIEYLKNVRANKLGIGR